MAHPSLTLLEMCLPCMCGRPHVCPWVFDLLCCTDEFISKSQWQDLLSFFQIWLCLYLNPSLSFLFPSVCNKSNYSRLKRPWQTCCMSSVLYSTKALKPIDIPMGLTERALTVHYNNFYSSRCVCFSSVLWCFVFPSHRNIVIIWQDTESSLEDQIWKFHKFKFRFKIIWLMFRFKLI